MITRFSGVPVTFRHFESPAFPAVSMNTTGPVFTKPPAVMGRCRLSNTAACGPALVISPPVACLCWPAAITEAGAMRSTRASKAQTADSRRTDGIHKRSMYLPNVATQDGAQGGKREAGRIATIFYLFRTWYNGPAYRFAGMRRRYLDYFRAPDRMRTSNASFDTTSRNPSDSRLPRQYHHHHHRGQPNH